MKEVFLLKAGNTEMFQTGTETSVLKDGDFFEIKKYIALADAASGKKVPVIMLHTHPRGVEQLSQDDIDTLTGFRFGLDRDFIAGIVFLNGSKAMRYKLYDIRLDWRKVRIYELHVFRSFWLGIKFELLPALQKLVKLSNYE